VEGGVGWHDAGGIGVATHHTPVKHYVCGQCPRLLLLISVLRVASRREVSPMRCSAWPGWLLCCCTFARFCCTALGSAPWVYSCCVWVCVTGMAVARV
jgi:hypothetical protein